MAYEPLVKNPVPEELSDIDGVSTGHTLDQDLQILEYVQHL